MRINSLKGAVNLVRKLQAKLPEMTVKNGQKAKELLAQLLAVYKSELLAIFD